MNFEDFDIAIGTADDLVEQPPQRSMEDFEIQVGTYEDVASLTPEPEPMAVPAPEPPKQTTSDVLERSFSGDTPDELPNEGRSAYDIIKSDFDSAVGAVTSFVKEGGGAVQTVAKMANVAHAVIGKTMDPKQPISKDVVENIREISEDTSKWRYMFQGMYQLSLTGQVLRQSLEREIDKDMENRLNTKDKLLMQAGAMLPDVWLFALGGWIPKITEAGIMTIDGLKTLPVMQKVMSAIDGPVAHAASSFGFFEGIRTIYTNAILKDGEKGKLGFIDMLGKAMYDSLKGGAVGAVMGQGQVNRKAIFEAYESVFKGTAVSTAVLPAEAASIALLQAQLHEPGRLPNPEEFKNATILMMGFETLTHFNRFAHKMTGSPVFQNTVKAGNRYGTNPEMIAEMAMKDVTILEDLNRASSNGRIRSLEKDATGKSIPNEPEVDDLLRMMSGGPKERPVAKAGKAPAEEAAAEGATRPLVEGPAASAKPTEVEGMASTTAPPQQGAVSNTLLQDLPGNNGLRNPMNLKEGEAHDVITTTDGSRYAVPHSFEKSLTLSGPGLLSVPYVLQMVKGVLKGNLRIEKRRAANDKNLETSWGYFSSPEREYVMRLADVTREVDAAKRSVREARRRMDPNAEKTASDLLTELKAEKALLDNTEYSEFAPLIVINEEVSQGRSPMLLGVLTHEIGHLIAAGNKGWKEGRDPANADIFKPGLSDSFWTAMSNYHQTFDAAWHWALDPVNNVNPKQLMDEAMLISRLWRPISDAALLADQNHAAYRNKGSELIADIVSVHMHRPDIIRDHAPTLAKALDVFFNGRDPSIKEFIDRTQQDFAAHRDLEASVQVLNESTRKGEFDLEDNLHGSKNMTAVRRAMNGTQKLLSSAFDSFHIVYDLVPKLGDAARNAIERFQYATPMKKGYYIRVSERLVKPLADLGFAQTEIGALLSVKRIIHDETRHPIFNGAFGDVADANKMYDQLIAEKRLSEPQVEGLLAELGKARQETLIQRFKEAGLHGDDFLDLIESNKWYVRFESMEHAHQAVLEGNYAQYRGGKRGSRAMTAGEAEKNMKQTGSLGGYRNSLAATMAYDDYLFNMLLREGALKKVINHGVQTREFPVFSENQFKVAQKYAKQMFGAYSVSDFQPVSIPERVLDPATGKTITVRRTWMMPKDVLEPFVSATPDVKQFLSDIATVSTRDLVKDYQAGNSGKGKLAMSLGAKALAGGATIFRTMAILANMGFQVKNLMLRDPGRSARNLATVLDPNRPGYHGSGRVWEIYGETYKTFIGVAKNTFQNKVDSRMLEMFDKGYMSAREEFISGGGPVDLGDRTLAMYGSTGYRNKVRSQMFDSHSLLLGGLERTAQRFTNYFGMLTDAAEMTSKIANNVVLHRLRSGGKVNIGQDTHDRIIRGEVGSPPYQIKGSITTAINLFSPFLGAIVNGLRGDYHAFQRNNKAFLMASSPTLMFGFIQGLALSGAVDDAWDWIMEQAGAEKGARVSDIMNTAGSRELASNLVIPIGTNSATGAGRRAKITLLQDPWDIFLHNSGMHMGKVLCEMKKSSPLDEMTEMDYQQAVSLATGVLFDTVDSFRGMSLGLDLNVNPVLSSISKGSDLLQKGNYHDPFTGRMRFRNNELDGKKRLKALPGLVSREFAVPKSIRNTDEFVMDAWDWIKPDKDETSATFIEKTQKFMNTESRAPFYGEFLSSFYASDNQGYEERNAREKEKKAYEKAAMGDLLSEALDPKTQKDPERFQKVVADVLKHERRGEISTQMWASREKIQDIAEIPNIYLKDFAKDGSNASVDKILRMNGRDQQATEAYQFLFGGRQFTPSGKPMFDIHAKTQGGK